LEQGLCYTGLVDIYLSLVLFAQIPLAAITIQLPKDNYLNKKPEKCRKTLVLGLATLPLLALRE
jgi:hypothetical protein